MSSAEASYPHRYGPWALVAGASEGIGAAFATELARRGLHLLLLARRVAPLEALAQDLATRFGVSTVPVAMDLGRPDLADALRPLLAEREVGMLVCNAAIATTGPFLQGPLEGHLAALDVNCRAPLVLSHLLGGPMAARGRGGIIIVSSMAGLQGAPLLANYGAGKAYGRVLAEGLWAELGERGVDVLACVAGATSTPGYLATAPKQPIRFAPRVQAPVEVALEALRRLGRTPTAVTGRGNRWSAWLLSRLLPRSVAIRLMGSATRKIWLQQ